MAKDPVIDYYIELVNYYRDLKPTVIIAIRKARTEEEALAILQKYEADEPKQLASLVFTKVFTNDLDARRIVSEAHSNLRSLLCFINSPETFPPDFPPQVKEFLKGGPRPHKTP